MPGTLYLFPDTNLLVQCRRLHELGWEKWKDFDEVHLIICRAVQSEIDKHKNVGKDRVAKRARDAWTLLRDLLAGTSDHLVVRDANPCVKLFIKVNIKPSPGLADQLDYDEPDDRLVGTVHSFISQMPGADARVLTRDAGPMATAKMVGIKWVVIPDEWLLPPEPSGPEKRINALETELARLKRVEPEFCVACVDQNGAEVDVLRIETKFYEPMTDSEVTGLMDRLKERCPIATDFGPREATERQPGSASALGPFAVLQRQYFTPATEKEIENYRSDYADWLEKCEIRLRALHVIFQKEEPPPFFIFRASNDGTRPATDALVTITAQGAFKIMPPSPPSREDDDQLEDEGWEDDDDREEDVQAEGATELPNPPSPPRGSWSSLSAVPAILDALRGGLPQGFMAPLIPRHHRLSSLRPIDLPGPRDPNSFYYKPERPEEPVGKIEVECQQWRHGVNPEDFTGVFNFTSGEVSVEGALELCIRAANMANVKRLSVPVRAQVEQVKTYKIGEQLVERVG